MTQSGDDPMDQYSEAAARPSPRGLATILSLCPRANSSKPGRSLLVVWDQRKPLMPEFANAYSYVVTFDQKWVAAGNHFHRQKAEIFFAIQGEMTLIVQNHEQCIEEEIRLNPNEGVHIRAGLAHAVFAESPGAILLVLASHPNNKEDEFPLRIWDSE